MSRSQPKHVGPFILILIKSDSNSGKCKMLRSIGTLVC